MIIISLFKDYIFFSENNSENVVVASDEKLLSSIMDRTCIKSRPLVTMGNVVALVLTVHVASPLAAYNINQVKIRKEGDSILIAFSH